MKLSKRGEYALRALIDLGIAQELGRPLLKLSELVEKERLPLKFLEQIFAQLKTAGYISTRRGKEGGYFLAKPPQDISLGQIVRLIDGPLAPIACVSQTAYERCSCPEEEYCGLHMLMLDVRNAIASILDSYHLSDIVKITLRKMRRDNVAMPFAAPVNPGPVIQGAPRSTGENPEGDLLSELLRPSPLPGTRGKTRNKRSMR